MHANSGSEHVLPGLVVAVGENVAIFKLRRRQTAPTELKGIWYCWFGMVCFLRKHRLKLHNQMLPKVGT